MTVDAKRRLALALAIAGALIAAATVTWIVVIAVEPWRVTALLPLEPPLRAALVVALGVALLGVAARLGLRNPTAAKACSALAGVLTAAVILVGGIAAAGVDLGGLGTGRDSVAKSPDGRYELIRIAVSPDERLYRLRSHGFIGLEGKADVACTPAGQTRTAQSAIDNYIGVQPLATPTVRLASARFTDGNHLELHMTDGSTETVGFNPDTLRPDRSLTWC